MANLARASQMEMDIDEQ